MKKIGILVILALAVGVGIFSYKEVAKASSHNDSNQTIGIQNNGGSTNTTSASNTSQQNQNTQNNTSSINTEPTTNTQNNPQPQTSSKTKEQNELFGYNFGVNIFYNENINPSYKNYESTLTEKFKSIYGNMKNVIVKVSDIYLTSNNGNVQATALYTAQYDKVTKNGATEYYTAPPAMLSANVTSSISYTNTALFPEQLDRTSTSSTVDGITYPANTPYRTYTQNGVSQTMYFANIDLNTNNLSTLTVYPTINDAKNNTNEKTLKANATYAAYVLNGYILVYNYQTKNSGYMKFDNNIMTIKKNLFTPEGEVNPLYSYAYSNSPTYLNDQAASSYNLYAVPTSNSPVIGTVSSKDIVRVMSSNSGAYTLVGVNGILAYIKTSALLENAPTIPTVEKVVYPETLNKLLEPIGYNLTLKGKTQEGSNMSLLKTAMNYKFNGTGYTVVATNTEGYEGMMHTGCYYNITYTSPSGHVTTLNNQSINGLTNPDNGAFAFWFGNTVNNPFNF